VDDCALEVRQGDVGALHEINGFEEALVLVHRHWVLDVRISQERSGPSRRRSSSISSTRACADQCSLNVILKAKPEESATPSYGCFAPLSMTSNLGGPTSSQGQGRRGSLIAWSTRGSSSRRDLEVRSRL